MIVVRIWEGIGNQMFQYAYAKALERETGIKVCLEIERVYRDSFKNEDLNVERKYSLENFNISLEKVKINTKKWDFLRQKNIFDNFLFFLSSHGYWFNRFYTDIEDQYKYKKELLQIKNNSYVMGHFMNKKYYDNVKEILKEEFQLKNEILLSNELEEIFMKHQTVSVHIRRGDYVLLKSTKDKYYYFKAIKYMNNKIKDPFYIVFSDDIEWTKQNLDFGKNVIFISEYKYEDYEELILMSKCNYNIIANSTFSYWGAWLNPNPNKIVIAPANWMSSVLPNEWLLI